ncbi:hypothetical protein NFI96_023570 [Prochilodus magdalenae]|nr:hypothetical protein NFI96_023570 [Prochilodus magdalenae]
MMFGAMKMHSHTLIRNLEKTAELKSVVEVKHSSSISVIVVLVVVLVGSSSSISVSSISIVVVVVLVCSSSSSSVFRFLGGFLRGLVLGLVLGVTRVCVGVFWVYGFLRGFLGGYTMDVITSSAFSIDNDSLNNPKEPFVANVKKLLDFDFFSPMLLIGALFPFTVPLLEKMNFAIISSSVVEFFFAILQKIKDERGTQDHKSRVDFMQLMVDSQTPEKAEAPEGEEITRGLSDHEIFSQSIFFILASYETSGTLSFFFYNLATNPEEMRKLQEEIDRTFPDEASVQYNAVMGLDYLDAAIKESMRLYPVAARLERVCKKTVEINGLTIPKGTIIIIPTLPLHRDPEYWPDPETFKPERFTKENKERIDPYVFMPFGSGPRNCIGMRFALVLMKLVIVQILRRFDVNVCDETKVPLEFGLHTFLSPKDPIKLKFTPRANTTSHCSES